MQRFLTLWTVGGLFWFGSGLVAEEPHRDFVRGLRERHYTDLALIYLEKLSKNPSAETAKWLPLELAKTRVDMAREEADAGKRGDLFAKAKEEFQSFIKNNAADPRVNEANLELARIIALQGKMQLSKALRQESADAKKAEAQAARTLFEEAGKSLTQVAAAIEPQLVKLENPQTPQERDAKRDLTQAKLQADLDIALNLFDQIQTFDDVAEVVKRAEMANKARELLVKVANRDETNPLCWVARAWVGRCWFEVDDNVKAKAEYRRVIDEPGAHTDAGKRVARYFNMLVIAKTNDPKVDPLAENVKEGEAWRRDYPSYYTTPEGCGVTYELADAYFKQAIKSAQAQPRGQAAMQLYARAEKLFGDLEQIDNDYQEKARTNKLIIVIKRSGDRTGGDITKLANFQECYLRAQVEIAQMNEEGKKEGPTTESKAREEKRQKHFETIIAVLQRALDLADDKTTVKEKSEAQYIMGFSYLSSGDAYRAALLCDDLARSDPKSPKSPTAAAYALQGYVQILADEESNAKRPNFLKADGERLRRLALFMEQTWPSDSVTDVARHQLGTMALRDKNFAEAIQVLSRIRPTYGAYIISQFILASAAMQADKEKLPAIKGQPPYGEIAATALKKIPDLPANADVGLTTFYINARVELAKVLFGNKQYKEMKPIVDDLTTRFPTLKTKLPQATQDELQPVVDILPLYVTYGLADVEFRAGRFAEVRKLIDPLVARVKENKAPETAKDPEMLRGLLGLALRANVLEGNMTGAKDVLELLQKTAGDLQGGTTGILMALVQQLKAQLDELKQRGDGAKDDLAKTTERFLAFLDELAKQPAKDLKPEIIRFLAFSYSGLDKHEKAAELLAKIPKPALAKIEGDDKEKKEKLQKENEEKVAFYHAARLMLCREYRLSKKYDDAGKLLKEIKETDLGAKSIDVQKEENMLLEDQEKWVQAIKGWDAMMKKLKPLIGQARFKDQYYDCYYHFVYSYTQYAMKQPDEQKKQGALKRAATFIIKLEESKPDFGGEMLKKKYDDLFQKEPALKEMYNGQKTPAQG